MSTPISQPTFLHLDSLWEHLLQYLPSEEVLLTQAKESGALQRLRGVKSASSLLRILLSYAACDLSLCATSAWARANRSGRLSDVAVLNHLRKAGPWLEHLCLQIIAARNNTPSLPEGMQLRLTDGTAMSIPGSFGTDWRLHIAYNPIASRLTSVEVTPGEVGEHLNRFKVKPNELWIADRAYGFRRSLYWVRKSGGHFIVRIPWKTSVFNHPDGRPFDLFEALRKLPKREAEEFKVCTESDSKSGIPAMEVRLVAMRKDPVEAEKAKRKVLRAANKKQRGVEPETLEACEYIMVLTSLPFGKLSPSEILSLYRLRWQVELVFKRLKSLLGLDKIRAKDPAVVKSYLLAKVLGALLIEEMAAFSPLHTA